jgi:hypothetical protein
MKNIRVIKTGINVKKILEQIKQHPEDWGALKTMEGAKQLDPEVYVFENGVEVDTIQLIMGAIAKEGDFVGDSEMCIPTPAYRKHTDIIRFLKRHFKTVSRCGFLAIPVGATVGRHIDEGTYYLTRDRYHLSIQGRYEYFVGDESVIVEPGTLLWFNNKLMHGTKNIGDVTRITFVFDVPHSKSNP